MILIFSGNLFYTFFQNFEARYCNYFVKMYNNKQFCLILTHRPSTFPGRLGCFVPILPPIKAEIPLLSRVHLVNLVSEVGLERKTPEYDDETSCRSRRYTSSRYPDCEAC